MKNKIFFFTLVFALFCSGCVKFTPKPTGYIRISFPNPEFSVLDTLGISFSYDETLPDSIYILPKEKGSVIKLGYEDYSSHMILNTYHVTPDSLLQFLDSLDNNVEHSIRNRKEQIVRTLYENPEYEVFCRFYTIKGATPTPYRWIISNNKDRISEGLFIFDVAVNIDSLRPIKEYMEDNIHFLIESFRWN